MRYSYICECGETKELQASIKDGPPQGVMCPRGHLMCRDWQADVPELNIAECRDHNEIPFEKRVADASRHPMGISESKAWKMEQAHAASIQQKRRMKREGGSKKMPMTASYPAELYHGKIRETGDRNYWDSPKNRSRHKEFEV